jgi:hypothetical protein
MNQSSIIMEDQMEDGDDKENIFKLGTSDNRLSNGSSSSSELFKRQKLDQDRSKKVYTTEELILSEIARKREEKLKEKL